MREEGVVLEHHPDPPLLGRNPGPGRRHGAPRDLDRSAVGALEAGDEPEQCRLPAARGAEEGDDLAALDAQRGAVDRGRRRRSAS